MEATPNYDPEAADTCFKKITIEKGDLAAGFRAADRVIEGEYRTGHQEQLYIETNGVIAVPGDGRMTVYGSLQCPYYVHKALMVLLNLPPDKVRVIQPRPAAASVGRKSTPSMLACHAAILARKAAAGQDDLRPRRGLAGHHEAASINRAASYLTRDGRLAAMDIDVVMDGGAYATLSAVVLSRGVIHAAGPHRCDHVRIRGRAMMTNTPPNGAFRGFGAPQTQFAVEAHMDRIAEILDIDPVTLRARNALKPGDTTATTSSARTRAPCPSCAKRCRSQFTKKRRSLKGTTRGIGLSLFFHGSGFTGGGEVKLASKASLELTATGARILVGSTEIGQGTRTMHAQIVADALGVPFDAIEVHEVDTAFVPDSGPTVASRTCMIVGKLLERCAQDMKKRLGGLTPAQYFRKHGSFTVTAQYEPPPGLQWDDERYAGDVWQLRLVVQRRGARGRSGDLRSEADPRHCRGRDRQGDPPDDGHRPDRRRHRAGRGLRADRRSGDERRRMANAQLTNYIIPTPMDAPSMDVAVLERPYEHGPFGAKGVGEMPIDGPAPAVINALRHCGFDVRAIPATPES